MFFVEIGLMIAIIVLGSAAAKYFFGSAAGGSQHKAAQAASGKLNAEAERLRYQDRGEARALYERLVHEKLNVIRDAIAMGYSEVELNRLDKRLAELIGEDELKRLISADPGTPLPNAELLDTDLMAEREKLRQPHETD